MVVTATPMPTATPAPALLVGLAKIFEFHRSSLIYAAVILSGPITEVDRPVYEIIRSMALRYLGDKEGQEFADMHKGNRPSSVAFKLTPDSVVRKLNS